MKSANERIEPDPGSKTEILLSGRGADHSMDGPLSQSRFAVLILEDDLLISDVVASFVQTKGGSAVVCNSLAQARREIQNRSFDLFLLDQRIPDGTGSSFFYELRDRGLTAPAIMFTAQPDFPTAVGLTRNGLHGYLVKPFRLEELDEAMERAIPLLTIPKVTEDIEDFSGPSEGATEVRRRIQSAAAHPEATVLLTGETGVGKDLTARLIHDRTFSRGPYQFPFVSLNCANLPAEMFEAELFGAEKGAYTGAHQVRIGLAEAAQGGTLFLDELAELALPLQSKLLQFLETRQFRRLGSTITSVFTGRIIAATNRDIGAEVQAGRFRSDLWYRLDVISIHLPPLRERKKDLPLLTELLLAKLSEKYHRTKPNIRPEEADALLQHDFPGNVRELRNLLERSLLATPPEAPWLELDRTWFKKARTETTVSPTHVPVPPHDLPPMEAQEYALIARTLQEERGAIRRTAARLGMSHQKLLRRLEKWPELRMD